MFICQHQHIMHNKNDIIPLTVFGLCRTKQTQQPSRKQKWDCKRKDITEIYTCFLMLATTGCCCYCCWSAHFKCKGNEFYTQIDVIASLFMALLLYTKCHKISINEWNTFKIHRILRWLKLFFWVLSLCNFVIFIRFLLFLKRILEDRKNYRLQENVCFKLILIIFLIVNSNERFEMNLLSRCFFCSVAST